MDSCLLFPTHGTPGCWKLGHGTRSGIQMTPPKPKAEDGIWKQECYGAAPELHNRQILLSFDMRAWRDLGMDYWGDSDDNRE